MSNERKAIQVTYFSIATNTCLAVIKWLTGYFGNSYALVADAIESTADIFSSLLVLVALRYISRPADKNHPYGHGRAEPLITFLVVGFLVTSAVVIAHESIEHIRTPHKLPEAYTLIVLGMIIIWKELSYRLVIRKSEETKSSALKADAWHHRSDAITSVAAFVGISVALYFGQGYEAADDWSALVACGFILYNSYLIFRPALGEIMDEHLHEDTVQRVRAVAKKVEGVVNTEKCNVRKTGMQYHVDLHATVDANITVKQGHDIAHRLKDRLKQEIPQLADILIHIEPDR